MKLLRGFVMLGLALPATFAQYAGPAILSRGEAPAAMVAPKVDFGFSVAVNGTYTNGLSGISAPDSQGQLASQNSFGEGISVGLSGAHSWKHTHFGMNYSGSATLYNSGNITNGVNQGISLGLSHQFSPHVAISIRESAGWFNQFAPATVSLNSSVPFDPSQSTIPTTDFYDNRTIYESLQGNLTYQRSTRMSFSFGGGYFTNLRSSNALYNAQGVSASGDMQYRLSRRTSIGGGYSYGQYMYAKDVGGTNIHSVNMSLSFRASRWTEFSAFGGASRAESKFQQTVALDPNILAILCPPGLVTTCPLAAGSVTHYTANWSPTFGVRFSRSFRRGVAYLSAGEAIQPGNGLFLTSRQITGSAGYGYSGLRKWSLSMGVSYVTALSFANVQGGYGQVFGSYGMSRQLFKGVSFVSTFSATQYQSGSFSAYNRLIYSASVGLGYSSKNIPIRFF